MVSCHTCETTTYSNTKQKLPPSERKYQQLRPRVDQTRRMVRRPGYRVRREQVGGGYGMVWRVVGRIMSLD
jgi:hypothetical protein